MNGRTTMVMACRNALASFLSGLRSQNSPCRWAERRHILRPKLLSGLESLTTSPTHSMVSHPTPTLRPLHQEVHQDKPEEVGARGEAPGQEGGQEAGARTGMHTAAGGRRWKPCGAFVRARHSVLWGGIGRKARHGRPMPFGQMRNRSKLF